MTPHFLPSRRSTRPESRSVLRRTKWCRLGIEQLEERLAPDASLPPDLVVGRTLSAYSTASIANRALDITYTVYNQRADDIAGVLLTTTLQPGVAFTAATQLPDRDGQELAWSLGTLPGYGRASVTVTVSLPDPLPLQIDGGAEAFGTLNAGAVSADTPAATLTTRVLPADLLASTPDANTADPFVQEQAARLRYDPLNIFNYLNGEVGYESYVGSLRGARGTLWSAAGNSLDEASLGVALFRASGLPARYAHGTLSDALSSQLILSMFPPTYQTVGYIPPGTAVADPANDPKLLAETRDHFWLQVDTGAGFQNADTSGLPGGGIGTAFTTVAGTFAEVPDALRHKVEVKLDAETYNQASALFAFGNGLGRQTVLDRTFTSAELVGKPLTVGHFVDRTPLDTPVFSLLTSTYTPYLLLTGESFDPTNDEVLTGTPYQETATTFPLGNMVLTGLFLTTVLTAPGSPPATYPRTLADRIGPAARLGTAGSTVTVDPDALPLVTDIDTWTLDIRSSLISPAAVLAQRPALAAVEAATVAYIDRPAAGNAATLASAVLRDALIASARLRLAEYAVTSDTVFANMAAGLLVRTYSDSPAIVILSHQAAEMNGMIGLQSSLDLRKMLTRTLVGPGNAAALATGYTYARSMAASQLEGDAFRAQLAAGVASSQTFAVSTPVVLATAQAQGVPLVVLLPGDQSRLDALPLPADPKALIGVALAAGKVVVVPAAPVAVGGRPALAWYEVDPATGEATGVGEDGQHQSLLSYVSNTAIFTRSSVTNQFAEGVLLGATAKGFVRGVLFLGRLAFNFALDDPDEQVLANLKNFMKLLYDLATGAIEKALDLARSPFAFGFAVGYFATFVFAFDPPIPGILLAPDPRFTPRPGPTAAVDLTAPAGGLPTGPVAGTVRTPAVRAAGPLTAAWSDAGVSSFREAALSAPAATVRDATGTVVGTGAIAVAVAGSVSVTGPAGYAVTGTGSLAFYGPGGPDLGVAGEWDTYRADVTGDLTVTLTTDGLRLGGVLLPAGTYTLSAVAVRLDGRGPTSAPTFAGSAAVTVANGTVVLGPGSGPLTVAGTALDPAAGTTLGGYTGTLAVTPDGPAAVAVGFDGTAADVLRVTTSPPVVTADQNTPATFAATVAAGRADTYRVSAEAPTGWAVGIDAAGTATVTPAAGTPAGMYPVRVVAASTTTPDLVAQAIVAVAVAPTAPGVMLAVTPDLLLTVPFSGADLPTAFRAAVRNLGPVADTYTLSVANLPAGFTLADSGSRVTVPAGQTGVLGLYLLPMPGTVLPPPGTVLTFEVTATSTTDPALTRTQTVTFTLPAIHAVALTGTPTALNTTPGEPVTAILTVRAVGNVSETITLSAELTVGLTATGLPRTLTLAPGQTATVPVTVTPAADTPLNTTLAVTVTADLGTSVILPAQRLQLSVRVAVPGADVLATAATAAAELGNPDLAARLTDLSTALTNLVQSPTDAVFRGQAVAALDAVATLAAANPYLAAVLPDLAADRGQLAAATTAADVRAAAVALGDTLGDLGDTLAAEVAHRFDLSLPTNTAVAQPQVPATFNILLRNVGTQTTTYDLTVTGLPAGVTAAFSQDSVTLDPGQSTFTLGNPNLTVTLTPGAGEIAAFGFEVRATARPAPAITRTAAGSFTARREFVSVVAVTPAPAFIDPGGQVTVSARVLNAVNREQQATVRFVVTDAGGAVVFTSSPTTTTLGVLTSLSTVNLGSLDTTGFALGDYTLTVTVSDANGQPIPGATGTGHLLVGSPVTADLSVSPATLPAGTGTVSNTLVVESRAALVGPLGVLSQTDLPGAGGVARYGQYLYASGSAGVTVYNISDPSQPQPIRTFGSSATTLEIRGDKLYTVAFGGPFSRFPLMIYSLADPENPQLLGTAKFNNVDGIPYSLAWNMVVTDTHVFVSLWSTTFLIGGQNDIKYQTGDVIAFDVTDPTTPTVVSVLRNTYGTNDDGIGRFLNVDNSGGDGNLWEIVAADDDTLLVAGSTAAGDDTQTGNGVVHVIDVSDPANMAIVRTVVIPGTVQAVGLSIQDGRAFVVASQGGWSDPSSASDLTGNLVLATLDISDPRNPSLLHSEVLDRPSAGPFAMRTTPLGNGLIAFSSNGGSQDQPAIFVVDASDPARLVTSRTTIPAATANLDGAGNFLYSTSPSGLIIYQIDAPDAIPATARVQVPNNTGVTVVPGSFNVTPTDIIRGPDFDTYVFDLSLTNQSPGRTITWQSTVSDVQPGRSRAVATSGTVSFVSQGTSGQAALADQLVTGAQIVGLTPASRTAVPGTGAVYTVRLTNPTAAAVTYTLSVAGVPVGWVGLPATVIVGANGSVDVPLTLTSDPFAAAGGYGFTVSVSGSNGAASAVGGDLTVQGDPAPVDPESHGAVVGLSPAAVSVGRGGATRVVVRLTNTGSTAEPFALAVSGLPAGVSAAFDQPTVSVPPGAGNFREVVLLLTAAADAGPITSPFTVTATATTTGQAAGSVTVVANGVTVRLDRATAAPGDTLMATVTNTGTTADTFDLSAAGPAGLVASLGQSAVTLAPGASATVPLTAGPMAYSVQGSQLLTVAARSQANPTVVGADTAGIQVGPSVGLEAGFDPAGKTLAAPGGTDFLLTVRNTGNTEDVYTATITGATGPVTAYLVGLDGRPTQTIPTIRLPGLATGAIIVHTNLPSAGLGTVTVTITSQADPARTAASTATVQTVGVSPPTVPPLPPPPATRAPQPALVGGAADGTAVVLIPSAGGYAVGNRVEFFPGFTGVARVAMGDVTGDGVPDSVGGAGPGGGPRVAVIDGATGVRLADFFAFEDTFRGGVYVTLGDLDGDGVADLIVTPDLGGGPVVAAYSGAGLAAGLGAAAQTNRFFGIEDIHFRGGARAAAGDANGDGRADLIVSAGFPGGPRVAVFDGLGLATATAPVKLVPDFFAFEETFRNGSYVAAGDVDGDGRADLLLGAGPDGGPRVRAISGRRLLAAQSLTTLDAAANADPGLQLANFFASDPDRRGGVRAAVRDADGDGLADLLVGSGDGEPSRVRLYRSADVLAGATAFQELDPFAGAAVPNGVFVG